MESLVIKNVHLKDMYDDEIGLCVQSIGTTIGSIVQYTSVTIYVIV